jgi:ketosteroid isomerase-like protein
MRKMTDAALESIRLESASYELKPLSVRVIGEFSIVYYEAHAIAETKAGQEIATYERYTHIWMRTARGWKIIGGMSASLG